ncbi:MAG: hypothetical protein Q9169_000754 [Polycauliona sp. 2 TL-2023]
MGTPTPTSATRPTKSSASRGTPVAAPVKPPVRPAVNTTRSRPQSTIMSSASPSTAHKTRPSFSSVTSATKTYGGASVESRRGNGDKPPHSDQRSRSTSPIKPRLKSTVKQSTPRSSTTASKPAVASKVKTASAQDHARHGESPPKPLTADPQKKLRPVLGTRKSTMSVTIEQRLRDIQLVHQMLRVAMANDGDDDDEVKEQYGKEADERLTELRVRLEEARAAETRMSPEEQSGGQDSSKEGRESMFEAVSQKTQPEDLGQLDMQLSIEQGDEKMSRGNPPQGLAEDLSSDQDEVKLLQEENASLKKSLQYSQTALQSKESELDRLAEVIATMQTKLLSVQSEGEQETQRCHEMIKELRAGMEVIAQAKTSAEHEIQQLGVSKQQHVEQSRKNRQWLEQQLQQHEDAKITAAQEHSLVVAALRRELHETYEIEASRAAQEHNRMVNALRQDLQDTHYKKGRETTHLQEAVEALQRMVQEANENKQVEINELKDSLATDHENVVAELRVQLRNEAEVESKSKLDEVRNTLGIVHATNADLRQASDDAKQEHEKTVSELKSHLTDLKAQTLQLSTEKAEGLKQIQLLQDTEKTVDTKLRSMEEDLKQQSEKVVALQERLKDSQQENQSLSASIDGLEEELTRVNNQFRLSQQRAADYQSKLDEFQKDEAAKGQAIEQLAERRLVVRGLQQTVDTLRQEIHSKDTQLEKLCAERDATAKRTEATTSSSASQLEKLTTKLRTAQSTIDSKATRIREVESALKVTTAELVELQTERPSESSDSDAPLRRLSLRLSRWPKTDSSNDSTSGESYDWPAGENLSSHIQGQVCPPFWSGYGRHAGTPATNE